MKFMSILALLALLASVSMAGGLSDEAAGRVVKVVDGDTFDVQITESDPRLSEDIIRIRLADIDCPETRGPKACEAGRKASAYAKTWLLSNLIFLDLDDKTGQDRYGRWVAICYLSKDGKPGKNFNKQLVDAGHAEIKDFKDNEFNPESW